MAQPSTERTKKWRKSHPEYFQTEKFKTAKLNNSLKCRYNGFGLEDKRKMFIAQDGRCPMCSLALPDIKSPNCCVDHDHVSGEVRGLLHKACNVWLGYIEKHGVKVLSNVVGYLAK